MLIRLIDPTKEMDRGGGWHIPTKSQRGKWVAIDLDTIKVIRQSNHNQMRKAFMN